VTTGKPPGRFVTGQYPALDPDARGRRESMVGAICSFRGLPGDEPYARAWRTAAIVNVFKERKQLSAL